MTENMAIAKIEKHLHSPTELAKFVSVLDKSAEPFIQSVMLAVASDANLQKCSPESIGVAALRAATLQLSCDPATKQAYIIPRWNGKKQCLEAQFEPHYLGLYSLAVRTNKYSVIEVIPFPADYHMEFDINSGDYVILNGENKVMVFAPRVKPEEAGAWYGYLRTTRGFIKKIWMTKTEIHDYARKHNPKGYNADGSLWKKPEHIPTMEKKTVLKELLRWADKSGYGDPTLRAALQTEDPIDAEEAEEPVMEGKVSEESSPAPAPEPAADPGPKFIYNNSNIIEAVMKITSWSKQETAAAMSEAYKSRQIDKELTVLEAEKFARTFVPA